MTENSFEDPREFDDWAATYDRDVHGRDDFPFLGYDDALQGVVTAAAPRPPCSLLDLGIGTGNLAARFAALGCDVWGLDFSPKMLARARAAMPGAHLGKANLLGDWPDAFRRRFDRVVSAYAFHHFRLEEKTALLARLVREHLAPGGSIVIADISFPTAGALARAREAWSRNWDEEYYWIAEEALPACEALGFRTAYDQVSPMAGIYVLAPKAAAGARGDQS